MKQAFKQLILGACVLLLIAGCGRNIVQGEGNAEQEIRDVSTFTGLDVSGSYQIRVDLGSPQKLALTSNGNILPYVQTSVKSNILHVEDKSSTVLKPTVSQKIIAKVASFDSLTLEGSSTFQLSNLNGKSLTLSLSGSHQVYLAGKVEKAKIVLNGTSSINAKELEVAEADIEINGSGIVVISPKTSLDVVINGSGKVIYYGKAPSINQTIKGYGQVTNGFGEVSKQQTQ